MSDDPPDPEEPPANLRGRLGRVTVAIPLDGPGEIVVSTRGGSERLAAWCTEPVPKYTPVVIVDQRSPRAVEVTPFPKADPPGGGPPNPGGVRP